MGEFLDEEVLRQARSEILRSTNANPPSIIDPFAGGGTIPLEAHRLGLEAYASDLNPVAVLINKALIEIPPKFRDQPPVFPGLAESEIRDWTGAEGLAADVRAYGAWMRDEAKRRIGHVYPKVTLEDGSKATVVAWIWARTVRCPNPACGIDMPLVRSWWLGKKKGREAFVVPSVVADPDHPSGQRVAFEIARERSAAPETSADGTVGRNGAHCIACATAVELKYVRAEGRDGRIGHQLMAVAAEGNRQRIYVAPSDEHVAAADVERPFDVPDAPIPPQAPSFRVQAYGMTQWVDLFTNRQLLALTTYSDLVAEVRQRVLEHGGSAGRADAISTAIGLAVSRYADLSNAICSWNQTNENVRALFRSASHTDGVGFRGGESNRSGRHRGAVGVRSQLFLCWQWSDWHSAAGECRGRFLCRKGHKHRSSVL